MRIQVVPTYHHLQHLDLADKGVVVIDVLRATSTMTTALANGAKSIIPVNSPEEAIKKAAALNPENTILAGEQLGKQIHHFSLGNSPSEYKPKLVKNKTIVFTTTNGTKAIKAATPAKYVFLGCLLNGKAVAHKLLNFYDDLIIACSGTRGQLSLEDIVGAGMIIYYLLQHKSCYLTDLCFLAYRTFLDNSSHLTQYIYHSQSAQNLINLGFEEDLKLCSTVNKYNITPVYRHNAIIVD